MSKIVRFNFENIKFLESYREHKRETYNDLLDKIKKLIKKKK